MHGAGQRIPFLPVFRQRKKQGRKRFDDLLFLSGVTGAGNPREALHVPGAGKLVVRQGEADRRHACGAELIQGGACGGYRQVAARHEGSHVLYILMQLQPGLPCGKRGKLLPVRVHGPCESMDPPGGALGSAEKEGGEPPRHIAGVRPSGGDQKASHPLPKRRGKPGKLTAKGRVLPSQQRPARPGIKIPGRQEIIVDHQIRRTVEGPQVIQISGRKELPELLQIRRRHKVGVDQKTVEASVLLPGSAVFQQPLQGRKLRVRLPIVRMQDMDRKILFLKKRSEQSGGHRIRDGKLRLRSQLPKRRSDGKTPHQMPCGDIRISVRPYQNRFPVLHGSRPFLVDPGDFAGQIESPRSGAARCDRAGLRFAQS